jgi:hypothetical protein
LPKVILRHPYWSFIDANYMFNTIYVCWFDIRSQPIT